MRNAVSQLVRAVRAAHDQGLIAEAMMSALVAARLAWTGRAGLARGLLGAGAAPGPQGGAALDAIAAALPGSVWAQYLVGLAMLRASRAVSAEAALLRALALRPDYLPARAALAGAWIYQGQFDRAAPVLREATARKPRKVVYWNWYATDLMALGRRDEATVAYRRAATLRPNAVEPLTRLADHLLYLGQEAEARGLLVRIMRLQPGIDPAHWNGDPATRPNDELRLLFRLQEAYRRLGLALLTNGAGAEIGPIFDRAQHAQETAAALVRGSGWLARHGVDSEEVLVLPPVWTVRISHAALLDRLLKQIELGRVPRRRILLLAPPATTANRAYVEVWRPHVEVISDPARVRHLLPVAMVQGLWVDGPERLPDGRVAWFSDELVRACADWSREERPPLVAIAPEQREAGREVLARAGISRDAWFVALHVREAGFHGEGELAAASFRNADIRDFAGAMRAIRKRGGHVVRLGDPSMIPLAAIDGVFDYALSPAKCDWMDVFLCAEARFFVGSTSGLYAVAASFGVPCVLTDWASYVPIPSEAPNLYIPKLIARVADGATLTFAELLAPEMRWLHTDGRLIAQRGLRYVNNTPDEMTEIVEEMIDRLDGTFLARDGDDELVAAFERAAAPLREIAAARVSTRFLRRHAALLV